MNGIKVQLTGKLGKDPELKGEGDKQWMNLNVATERYVGAEKGDPRQDGSIGSYKTSWVSVAVFGRTAQFVADRFSKGDTIVVSGDLELTSYEKKQDGNVIDANALGVRVKAQDIAGPFRTVVKNENGNQQGQQTQQRSAPAQRSSNGNGNGNGNGQASGAQQGGNRATHSNARQGNVQASRAAVADDDSIPF